MDILWDLLKTMGVESLKTYSIYLTFVQSKKLRILLPYYHYLNCTGSSSCLVEVDKVDSAEFA